jgi:taurine dioxygenase
LTFAVHPFAAPAGAEVVGLKVDQIGAVEFSEVRQAFLAHGFLVFRDQHLSPESHVAFSAQFGALKGHVLRQYLLPGSECVLVLSNKKVDGKPVGLEDAGRYWHSDVSYEEVPPLGSMLYAIEIPPEGGDTLFANQYAAYAALPPNLKQRIAGLKARHIFNYSKLAAAPGSVRQKLTEEQERELAGAIHPVVRTHPDTGRQALYVNPGFTVAIEGLSDAESKALLAELWSYATAPAIIARQVWQPHDLVLWDNRCLMHHATAYPPQYVRHMHRTTIAGTRPY